MVNDGLGRDAEELAGGRGDLADRGLAAGADVERLAVVGRREVQRGVDERLGDVVDVDEVARDGRVDELAGSSPSSAVADHVRDQPRESSSGP